MEAGYVLGGVGLRGDVVSLALSVTPGSSSPVSLSTLLASFI